MRRFWPWLCALLSGILLALAFPPADWSGLAWVALTPLICALWFSPAWKKAEPARLFLLGYVTGLGYFIGSLHWISLVTFGGWLVLCLYIAIYPGLWALFTGTVAKPRETRPLPDGRPHWMRSGRNLLIAALSAAAWTATEWARGLVFSGFGWNGLGVTLHDNFALIQICDITGVGGLSFLLVMVNLMIVITVKRLRVEVGRHKLRPHYDFSLTVALVAIVFAYGVRQMLRKPPESETITVAAIQANVPIPDRRNPTQEQRILDLHVSLSEKAIALKPDLLIWPEAATPRPLLSDQETWDIVRALAEKNPGDFLTGTVYFGPEGDYNSAVLLTDKAKNYQIYHKMHLVPFGEYVPMRHSFPLFAWIVGDLVSEDFDFGQRHQVMRMKAKDVRIASLICFEDTLGDLARRFALGGAQMFVNVTNDAWFQKSVGSVQHLRQAIFRSVETKLPMVRAANTGVSCVIDRFGRVQQSLTDEKGSTFLEGMLLAPVSVPTNPTKTFYTQYGELFSMLCLGATLAAVGASFLRRRT